MTLARAVVQAGAFVAGTNGSRFRLVSEPSDQERRGTVIFVHGFAEEMNKSRRMAARMTRLLAADGWRVVQRDLSGCGDSSGEFADASWAAWIDDVDAEMAQAMEDRPVWLWCLRAGALLVPALLSGRRNVNLLLWQPVLSGAQHLQQFLRLHAGARIVGSGNTEGGLSPTQALRAGTSVEIGGYQLSAALATALELATFDVPAGFAGRIVWFELSADEVPEISPQAARAVERLSANGLKAELRVLRGPPFWQTQEIVECELLLEQTRAELGSDWLPDAAPTQQETATKRTQGPGGQLE